MDVDTLRISQSPGVSENTNERRNRAQRPERPDERAPAANERPGRTAEQGSDHMQRHIARHERSNVTVRSSRFRSAVLHRRRTSSFNMPERSSTRMQVEFDREAEQFRMVKRSIENANRRMIGGNSMFQYSIHELTNQIMVKVIDRDTKELLLEIPPEKVLDAIAKMWELSGIFVDERL
jgi:uncharacterized FlaG/YvyC family protein